MLSTAGSRLCALILVLASLALAASPTSFCKCTCFGSYKIIPLDAPADASDPTSGGNSGGSTGSSSSSSSPNLRSSRSVSDLLHLRRNSNSDKIDTRLPLATRQDSNDSSPDSSNSNSDPDSSPNPNRKEYRTKTCNDCNRSFCLEQNLPECRDAEDKDVFATCFQRDSSKDQAVVYLFLATTVSLLGWAVAKPCLGAIGSSTRMGMGSSGGVTGGAGWLSSLGRGRGRSGTGNGQMYMPVTEQDR